MCFHVHEYMCIHGCVHVRIMHMYVHECMYMYMYVYVCVEVLRGAATTYLTYLSNFKKGRDPHIPSQLHSGQAEVYSKS